jgi:hypothetical protein
VDIRELLQDVERHLDSRLKLKTRRLWDGSLHRETQKNPRPQGERILR